MVDALRKNAHNWTSVGSDNTGNWEMCEVIAIVYENGLYEVAYLEHNLATIVRDYAELNGYVVVGADEVVG